MDNDEEKLNGCCLWRKTCEICGCIFYSERIILDKDSKNKGCCQLLGELINNFCENALCNVCNCRKNQNKNFCCSCCNYEEIHFEKNKQCFCYCYQEKGFCDYSNKFITNGVQREILFCVILYFIEKLAIIGCEKEYESILQNYDIFEEIPLFLSSFGMIFLSISAIIFNLNKCKCSKKRKNQNQSLLDEDINILISKAHIYSNEIFLKLIGKFNKTLIGVILVFTFNISFGFFNSFIYIILGNEEKIFDITERIYLYITILINAYLTFLLNYYCLSLAKSKIIFEFLFTPTILITIYITIIDFIMKFIKLLLQNIYYCFFLQLIISGFFFIFIFLSVFRLMFIFNPWTKYKKGICICLCCCCDDQSKYFCDCCNSKCSSCNCSYLCCEPCFLKLSKCLFN